MLVSSPIVPCSRRRHALLLLSALPLILALLGACQPMSSCGGLLPSYRDCRPFGALHDLFSSEPEPESPPKEPQELIICRDRNRNYTGYYADTCPAGQEKIG